MLEHTRRKYLKSIGIITAGITVAGCSGGDEGQTPSSEDGTPTDTAPSEETDPATDQNDTETEDTTTQTESGNSLASLQWVPSAQVFGKGQIINIGASYPSQIIDTVSDSHAETYNEGGYFAPVWTETLPAEIDEYSWVSFEDAPMIRMNEAARGMELPGNAEKIAEYEGHEILRADGAGDGGLDVVLTTDGDSSFAWTRYDLSYEGAVYDQGDLAELLKGFVDAKQGNELTFANSRLGQNFMGINHEDVFYTQGTEDQRGGERYIFGEESFVFQRLTVGPGQNVDVDSENKFPNEEMQSLSW